MLVLSDNASDCSRLMSIGSTLDNYLSSVETTRTAVSALQLETLQSGSEHWLELKQVTLCHPITQAVLLRDLSLIAPRDAGIPPALHEEWA